MEPAFVGPGSEVFSIALAATVLLPAAGCEVSVLAFVAGAGESAGFVSFAGVEEVAEVLEEPPMLRTLADPVDSTLAPPSPPIDSVFAAGAGLGAVEVPLVDDCEGAIGVVWVAEGRFTICGIDPWLGVCCDRC